MDVAASTPDAVGAGEAFRLGRTWLRIEEEAPPEPSPADVVVLEEDRRAPRAAW